VQPVPLEQMEVTEQLVPQEQLEQMERTEQMVLLAQQAHREYKVSRV
jgi:hypothetical protein